MQNKCQKNTTFAAVFRIVDYSTFASFSWKVIRLLGYEVIRFDTRVHLSK